MIMSRHSDTIVAPATPHGTSALAIVRVSGPDVPSLTTASLGGAPLTPRLAVHRQYRAVDGRCLDDVVATWFEKPKSFTGDHLLEISTHGNPLIVQQVMADLLVRGCRMAEPGEFTRRAFLNGRLDLTQAEAVMDVIHARSETALAAAQQQLKGSLGRHITLLREQILQVLARVEAYIDFPEEDLPADDEIALLQSVQQVLRGTTRLLATHHYGDLLRDGIRTVIIGETNVGKSSLLNALVGRNRMLVSAEPGTTRDYVEERLTIGPHLFRLTDTAGLNAMPGQVEQLGILKTLERAAEADLLIWVCDATSPTPPLPDAISRKLTADNVLMVLNKSDLLTQRPVARPPVRWPIHRTSATTNLGVNELGQALARAADRLRPDSTAEVVAINSRHAAALSRAERALRASVDQLQQREPVELLASNLRDALDAIGEIGGRVDNEEVLDRLFATFCIGK